MAVTLFIFILCILLALLVRETVILLGLLIQLAFRVVMIMLNVCWLIILLGERIGRKLWRLKKPRPRVRARARPTSAQPVGELQKPIQLIERNGVYVPSKGEW